MIHHLTRLAFVGCLLPGTAATAQTGPEIAYASTAARGGPEVHLTNPDSTGRRLLYKAPMGTEIHHIDIKPGGGELAIEEHKLSKSLKETASAIRIIKYDASASLVGSIETLTLSCRTGSLDYHATDGSLLYRDCSTPKRIRRLNTTTLAHSDLGLSHAAFIASWLDATRILYYTYPTNSADRKFWTVSTADLAAPTAVLAFVSPGSLDTSTAGDKGLWSFGTEGIDLLQTTPPQIRSFQRQAGKGHFSPDDVSVAYIAGFPSNQFVLIRRLDGSGSTTTLVGAGTHTALDWRN